MINPLGRAELVLIAAFLEMAGDNFSNYTHDDFLGLENVQDYRDFMLKYEKDNNYGNGLSISADGKIICANYPALMLYLAKRVKQQIDFLAEKSESQLLDESEEEMKEVKSAKPY